MKLRKFKLRLVIALFALMVMAAPAFGWEFNLRGATGYVYQYYSQMGQNGFFGTYNVDNGTVPGNFSPANGWLGPQVNNLVSGTDASINNFSTLLFSKIRMNKALSLDGVFRIGNTDTDTFPGSTVSWALLESLQWWLSAKTPWGLVSYGKRPFFMGCGLQFDAGNRTQEHLSVIAYSGPLTYGLGIYPWRPIPGLTQRTELVSFNPYDKSAINTTDLYGFVDYGSGPLNAGIGTVYYKYFIGPQGASTQATRNNTPALDTAVSEGTLYMKYNNGRFFFNAEGAWLYSASHWQKSILGTFQTADGAILAEPGDGSGDLFRPRYTEWWRCMAELGAMCGPAKLSLLYSFVPGPDRRHGVLIDKQPVLVDLYRPGTVGNENIGTVVFSPAQSNNSVFRPYSLIFNTDFGSGLGATAGPSSNVLGFTNDGYVVDASLYAARLDYAIAANVNLFASGLYATRVSNGYGWGYIKPGALPAVAFTPTGTFAAPSPAIPDNALGWEVDAGLSWKLIEGWQVDMTAGYWQPGKWFNYACVDRAVVGWDAPSAANNFGVYPDRSIDPIFAFVTYVNASF